MVSTRKYAMYAGIHCKYTLYTAYVQHHLIVVVLSVVGEHGIKVTLTGDLQKSESRVRTLVKASRS